MFKKKSILSLLLQYRYSFLAGVVSLSLVDVAQLAVPKIVQWVIDTLTQPNPSFNEIKKYGFYILALGLFMALFRLGWRYFIMGAARKIENSLRNEFFRHMQSLHFDFFTSKKVGDLMAHTVNDIETLKFSCGLGVLIAYDGVFLFFFIFIAMLFVAPELTLYAFIPFPFLAFFMYKFGNQIETRFQKSQDSFSELTESARQSISGIKVVKAYNREQPELKDFEKASNDYLNRNINLIKIWGIYQPLITFIAGMATVIFIMVGGIGAINMNITLGKFTAMLVYLAMLTWPMMAMGWSVDIMKRGNASINRLNKIFAVQPKKEAFHSEFDRPISGDIQFRNLSFSYNGKQALRNVSLEIPKGNSLGITGTTGAGKTKLINLLMKVYDVDENQILIDQIDINKIPRERIQESIIYVPQNTTIFSGSVSDNITFMNPDLTEHQIVEAAKVAAIYRDITKFPNGFNTIVGERGLSLSGGQRQRIALARAILLKPKVLILDDVLSSLDLQTESIVFKNIINAMNGNTLVAISSRVPSISGFDNIAVFENGEVVEIGNHNELINTKGIYSSMYKMQTI
ncbi:MAG: ABC transporter ATP-binding protein [Thermodesulfobacteriota bacterium]